jgi:hypothetical protein
MDFKPFFYADNMARGWKRENAAAFAAADAGSCTAHEKSPAARMRGRALVENRRQGSISLPGPIRDYFAFATICSNGL